MRPEISRPAKYAETIGKRKFIKLSSSRQHEYLALLAREFLNTGDFPGFFARYRDMQSWVELDRYTPPDYLTDEEAIHEFYLFHKSFINNPVNTEIDELPGREEALSWQHKFDVTVVLDQVRSPYNAGSVLRLIDNFGFRKLVHNSGWLRLDHPQLIKAARGAQKWIPVEYKPDLEEWLGKTDLPVIGLEMSPRSVKIEEWEPVSSCIIIAGNEAYGIAEKLRDHCDLLVNIPMFGYKRSMNLHHALAISAYKIVARSDRI